MGDLMHDPGDHAAADDQHDDHEGGDLGERERERPAAIRPRSGFAAPLFKVSASTGSSTSASTIAMSSTISQPTAMRPRSVSTRRRSCSARSSTTVEATDKRETEHQAGAERPAQQHARAPMPSSGRDRDLHDRARDRDRLHLQQIVEREMQADAEHQQDDADFGELVGDLLVGHIARRERPDQDAGQRDSRPAARCGGAAPPPPGRRRVRDR